MAKKTKMAMMMLETMNESKEVKSEIPELRRNALVVDFYDASERLEAAKEDYAAVEGTIINQVSATYKARALSGEFTKSFNLVGDGKKVQVTFADRFKEIPANDEIRKSVDGFSDCFDQARKIELKKTDDETIEHLINVLGPEKFAEIFKVKLTFKTKPGFDQLQFEASSKIRVLAVQYKPSVKKLK